MSDPTYTFANQSGPIPLSELDQNFEDVSTFEQQGANAVAQSLDEKVQQIFSITDYMTDEQRAAYFSGTYGAGVIASITIKVADAIAQAVSQQLTYAGGGIAVATLPRIRMPYGYLKLDAALTLPVYCVIDCEGTFIEQTTPATPIFSTANTIRATIDGATFIGDDCTAVSGVYAGGGTDSQIDITNCAFYTKNTTRYAIDIEVNAMVVNVVNPWVRDAPLFLRAEVDECFVSGGTVYGDLRSTGKKPAATCSFRNGAGEMFVTDVTFIPQSNATANANTRWFDNYGNLYLTNNRFGGEGQNGFPTVYQYSSGIVGGAGGSSRIVNGNVSITGGDLYTGSLSVRDDAGAIVLQNNVVPGTYNINGTTGNNASTFVSAYGYSATPATANAALAARILTQQLTNYACRIAIDLDGNDHYCSTTTFLPACLVPYTKYFAAQNTTDHAEMWAPGMLKIDSTYNSSITVTASGNGLNGSRHMPFVPGQKIAGIASGVAFDVINISKNANTVGAFSAMTGILSVQFIDLYAGPTYAIAYKEFLVQIIAPAGGNMALAQKDVMFLSTIFGDILTLALKAGVSATAATLQVIATDVNISANESQATWSFRMLSGTSMNAGSAFTMKAASV